MNKTASFLTSSSLLPIAIAKQIVFCFFIHAFVLAFPLPVLAGNQDTAQTSVPQDNQKAAISAETEESHDQADHAKILLDAANAAWQDKNKERCRTQLEKLLMECRRLPDFRQKAKLLGGGALLARRIYGQTDSKRFLSLAAEYLSATAQLGQELDDKRLLSLSWGSLGELYEQQQHDREALQLTRQAIFAAQQTLEPKMLYRWQWQAGRLLRRLKEPGAALDSYRQAIASLGKYRAEAAEQCAGNVQIRRQSINLHKEAVDLLLSSDDHTASQATLREARDLVEDFKADELRDFYEDDCLISLHQKKIQLDAVSRTAAIIYPISLPDRLELLVSLPGGIRRFTEPVTAETLEKVVRRFRFHLEKVTSREYLRESWQLYDWLIRPLEAVLTDHTIDTLVFVPDGALLTVPMAALHNGKQFLLEKYAIAVTPGLYLTEPKPLNRQGAEVLGAGITKAVQGFPPLPQVASELNQFHHLYGGVLLVNDSFRLARLEQTLKSSDFSILHIASHGEFGGSGADSYVLAYDGKLTIDRLAEDIGLFRFRTEPLELLTLSACRTAAGNDRAALGLAGVAVKAGARSALATLWYINDRISSEIMEEFYRQLQQEGVSRAKALRRAQLAVEALPAYRHPGFWSPFLLINNWL